MLNFKCKITSLINEWLSLKTLQPFYKRSYLSSLFGMNIGGDTNTLEASGEVAVTKFVEKCYNSNDYSLTLFEVGAHSRIYVQQFALSLKTIAAYCALNHLTHYFKL